MWVMSAPLPESDAFQDYRNRPRSDTLIDLLRAHQGRIFGLCYQVLRNVHDAEDAAQEVLLKIPGQLRKFADPESFRRWLYRVSLNQSLEVSRRDARRRVHEKRAAMKEPASESLDHVSRLALFEALAGIDDASRGLLLEHYFEGQPVGAIAQREACAPSTVCGRLKEARARLRRRLSGAVAMAALPDLEKCFTPSPAAPDLVTGAVLAKVAAVAGGAVMTGKTLIGSFALIATLLLCVGSGGAYWIHHRTSQRSSPVGIHPMKSATHAHEPVTATDVPDATSPAIDEKIPRAETSPLRARLDRFKKWWLTRAATKQEEDPGRNRHDKELWEQVSGLRDLVMADSEGFLAFLREPDNEALLLDLTQFNPLTQTGQREVRSQQPFAEYPQDLTRGLFDVLQTGTVPQRVAAFRLLSAFTDVPDEFRNAYLSLVDDPHPDVQGFAIYMVSQTVPMTPPLYSKFVAMGIASESIFVRNSVHGVMSKVPGLEAENYLLDRLAIVTNSAELFNVSWSLTRRYESSRTAGAPIQEERLARAIEAVIVRSEDNRFNRFLLLTATYLPGERLKPLLLQLIPRTRDDSYRGKLEQAVELIDKGGADRGALLKILEPWG
jgi:RNA polymerase sigma factor (sigma-70 family)